MPPDPDKLVPTKKADRAGLVQKTPLIPLQICNVELYQGKGIVKRNACLGGQQGRALGDKAAIRSVDDE